MDPNYLILQHNCHIAPDHYKHLNYDWSKLKDDIQENDVLLMKGAEEKLNHVALYIGNQTIFHHNIKQLSCRELYDLKYIQATKKAFRYAA